MYTDDDRKKDFDYFIKNYQHFYKEYGHCFLAIKNEEVLDHKSTIQELIDSVNDRAKIGDYIIQECNGDESAYTASIMRLMIHA